MGAGAFLLTTVPTGKRNPRGTVKSSKVEQWDDLRMAA